VSVFERVGIGLWTMRAPAAAPGNRTGRFRAFAEDARLVERLGFHSVWTAEHHAWYDGWCPSLIEAHGHAAALTERIRLGTAMLLLPLHDPLRLARSVATLDRLSAGRVDVGVGLGHRDPEFDLFGLRRDRRARLMEDGLDVLEAAWRGEYADDPPVQQPRPPIWMGGMAAPAIARAARRGCNLMLPQTLYPEQLRQIADHYRSQADPPGTVGCMRDVWVEPDERRARAVAARIDRHFQEEAGSWWVLKGQVGFRQPEQMERQLGRIRDTALIGSAERVVEGLGELFEAGAEFLVLRLNFDVVPRPELHESLTRLAEEVLPRLEPAAAASAG
jgi:alkanesulfonate monooxygenase SsuD/methylene tetrahydromethanopterin reductase-like flavin-dependent oxidoreductase (luciferase family)